jgi:hypothetical protein
MIYFSARRPNNLTASFGSTEMGVVVVVAVDVSAATSAFNRVFILEFVSGLNDSATGEKMMSDSVEKRLVVFILESN